MDELELRMREAFSRTFDDLRSASKLSSQWRARASRGRALTTFLSLGCALMVVTAGVAAVGQLNLDGRITNAAVSEESDLPATTSAGQSSDPACPSSDGAPWKWKSGPMRVASGETDGRAWVLCAGAALLGKDQETETLCIGWTPFGKGMDCFGGTLHGSDWMVTVTDCRDSTASGRWFLGAAPGETVRIEVQTPSSATQAELFPPPQGLGSNATFFVARAVSDGRASVTAYADSGVAVATDESSTCPPPE